VFTVSVPPRKAASFMTLTVVSVDDLYSGMIQLTQRFSRQSHPRVTAAPGSHGSVGDGKGNRRRRRAALAVGVQDPRLADRTLGQVSDAGARVDRWNATWPTPDGGRCDSRRRREAQNNAAELRQADAERRARGLVARLRAAWRGE
jgi:hypothetical protein